MEVKELSEFYSCSSCKDGVRGRCKECVRERARIHRATPEARTRKRDYDAASYATPEGRRRVIARNAAYNSTPEGKKLQRRRERASQFRKKYGLEYERYEAMFEEQGGRCAICQNLALPDLPLSVDHDHETGQIRGLLCRKCNTGIGQLGDDIDIVRRALDYLTASMDRWAETKGGVG